MLDSRKHHRSRTALCGVLATVFMVAAVRGAGAGTAPSSFEGRTDLPFYAMIALDAPRDEVAPYISADVRTIEVDGRIPIFVGVAIFDNTSIDFGNGTPRLDPDRFAYSDLAVATYGPDGSGLDAAGLFYVWRHASAPIFPRAMARLGVGCGGQESPQTRVCHVPGTTLGVEMSPTGITTRADVPWPSSPYSVSASFVPSSLPCAECDRISAWHAGSRGLVHEDVVFSPFPDSAIIGVGTGTVRARAGSMLYRMLGERTEATGAALLFRVHIDARFELR